MDFTELKQINEQNARRSMELTNKAESELANIDLQQTIVQVVKTLVEFLSGHTSKTVVLNQLREVATPDALKVAEAVEAMHSTLKTHENTDITPLVEVMNRVLAEAQAIPKSHKDIKIPEQKDWSKQFSALESAVNLATKAIEAQETTVEAPVVNVDAPKVEVEAPNLKPISKELKAVEKAVKAIVIPKVPKTDLSKLEKEQKETTKAVKAVNKTLQEMPTGGGGGGGTAASLINPTDAYAVSDVDESGDPKYYGFLKADGAWYIMRNTSDTTYRYASGTSSYNWSNRASESYDVFSEVF